jgi:putative hemolysin
MFAMHEPAFSEPRRPLPAPLGLLPESWPLPSWLRALIGRASGIAGVEVVAASLDFEASPGEFARQALVRLGVEYTLAAPELAQVPEKGGVIVVANHPFGGIDGLMAIHALHARRPDLKLLANGVLARLKPLQGVVLPVDTLGANARSNARSVRAALRHLAAGGALFTFPAGEVAHLQLRRGGIVDPPWPDTAARLIQLAGVPVVPMHFAGRNSTAFQLAGLMHARLRTLLLPRELLNKSGAAVQVRIGAPISARRVAKLAGPAATSAHLRASVRLLARAPQPAAAARSAHRDAEAVPLAAAIDGARIAEELAAVPAGQRLASSGALEVYCASAAQVPWTLQEIGRLREQTFRAVGEGTGRAADLDLYDDYYEHLFIWHTERHEIVGAYRIGRIDAIRQRFGGRGLYLGSLFDFREPFFALLGPALELGRSFVRSEYQRSYAPLLLLWKGISEYIGRNPKYAKVIGAASVSNRYDPLSRALLVEALRAWRSDPLLGALARPRRPFKPSYSLRSLFGEAGLPADIDALGSLIEDREPDGKGVPVLLRHYLKLGARTIGFNVDAGFADALDCLIVLDLRRVPVATLQKYMSATSVQRFRAYWRLAEAADSAMG